MHIISTLSVMYYTAHAQPYNNHTQNIQEVFNEWTVVVAAYHLLTFTDWLSDYTLRSLLGWSLLSVININILFNVGILANIVCR